MCIIESLHELCCGTFPTTTGANKGYCLSWVYNEVQAIEDSGVWTSRVSEHDIRYIDTTLEVSLNDRTEITKW